MSDDFMLTANQYHTSTFFHFIHNHNETWYGASLGGQKTFNSLTAIDAHERQFLTSFFGDW